ncbi:hypothetical protein J2X69_003221 [Algoriphagus sp. 4150]|nr:hypothetical protein [Algoriphagus sp. 4150]
MMLQIPTLIIAKKKTERVTFSEFRFLIDEVS